MTASENTAANAASIPVPPIACSLSAANLAEQAARWRRLAARAMTGRDQTPDGLRIGFRADPGVERELRELVAVENDCCGWATWTVEPAAQHLVLDVRSVGDGVAALHGMFTGLQAASEANRPG